MLCPYARFQSVLLDANSLIIGYDEKRGEKRGNPHKLKRADLGDCIDCHKCIRTCPTGIDIRDGLQLECIGCAKCIDACNSVMKAWNRPAGLVRYSSLNQFETGTQKKFRPRIVGYGTLILFLVAVSIVMIASRSHTHVDIVRTTGKPYFLIGKDTVSNVVNLRIRNNLSFSQSYALLPRPGCDCAIPQKMDSLKVDGGKTLELPLSILMPVSKFSRGKTEANFKLSARKKMIPLKVGLLGPPP
jgi:cytochrome c oxidase accessory protein FixG